MLCRKETESKQEAPQSAQGLTAESLARDPQLARLYAFERADITVLQRFAGPFYAPGAEPAAMVVGASAVREASIIRLFHAEYLPQAWQALKVAACTVTGGMEDLIRRFDRYDSLRAGPILGDARRDLTWAASLAALKADAFDFVYVRNPDFASIEEWCAVVMRAAVWTKPNGVIVLLSRKGDYGSLIELLIRLERHYHMTPAASQLTGVQVEQDDCCQHHAITILKGRA